MKPRACKPPALERDAAPTATARQQPLPLESPARRLSRPSAGQVPAATAVEKLWFCLWLPQLALEAVVRPGRTPAAVVEERQGVPRILLADGAATAAGILPGQTANAALALLPTLQLEERSVLHEQRALEHLAGWLERFSSFVSIAGHDTLLRHVDLLRTKDSGSGAEFGQDLASVRVLEQGNYWGRVVPLEAQPQPETNQNDAEPASDAAATAHYSSFVSVVYDRAAHRAFLAGFESSERWAGGISIEPRSDGGGRRWRAGFDGGDLLLQAGETIELESLLLAVGEDPWLLLEQYADAVCRPHPVSLPDETPVSWCSWYPYRLGVTEDRMLENARIAAARLKPLGLRIMEIDLGWQTDQLPSTFGENDQFPHGLKWLSEQLGELGLDLGVWTAPFTVSEFDPIVAAHPEWFIQDEAGNLVKHSDWFWVPHGAIYIPDLTIPAVQDWLRTNMESLQERGVRYVKSDFIGAVSDGRAKRRHDMRVVAGGGVEAARIGARIIREALPDALLLNCGGPEMPGTGHWPVLYTCGDTGNTGFISTSFQQSNYQSVACHLFKNRRWGILQPSCLCVGLPGAIDDAQALIPQRAYGHNLAIPDPNIPRDCLCACAIDDIHVL